MRKVWGESLPRNRIGAPCVRIPCRRPRKYKGKPVPLGWAPLKDPPGLNQVIEDEDGTSLHVLPPPAMPRDARSPPPAPR